ncbi:MAG TPA: penicillin acylase family protein [Dehalococcoidia bacterium]|nr:penicillin acylase family protein [Dehalococcoidia bacterium]
MLNPVSLASRARLTASQLTGLVRALRVAGNDSAHPQVEGRVAVDGAAGPIEVRRDHSGVPHVFAESDADAIYGQGFVHAQDRLFQMDVMRRAAAGRLSEVTGAGSLESDRFMRSLGLADRAAGDVESVGDEVRVLLDAYAAGVNAGIASLPALPPEFAAMGAEPEPWHPEHTLLLGRLIMFMFSGNWDSELLRERLIEELGAERAVALDRVYPSDAATAASVAHLPAVDRLLRTYAAAQEAGLPVGAASNAWAVDGAHSASGAPVLANDPHLQSQLPGMFHVSHISGGASGALDAIGATVPGVPGIASGHNGRLAWGLTAGVADVSDCYIETINPDDPSRYLTPDGWVSGRTRIERIEVRGGATVEERVLETRHGPVIGPSVPGEDRAVALRSTALEPGELASAFLGLSRATDTKSFERALDGWSGASFNFVWASREGGVGYRLVGRIPRRGHGEGLLPRDGAQSTGAPDPLPASALPRLVDPPGGAVVSANNAPGSDIELGEEWYEPWRAERIHELLDEREDHDIASMQAIQIDQGSRPLMLLRDLLLERESVDDRAAIDLIEGWHGQVSASSGAAAVLQLTYIELARVLVTRLAGRRTPTVLGNGANRLVPTSTFHYRLQGPLIEALRSGASPWLKGEADRDRVLRTAVGRALETLKQDLGGDAEGWSWGAIHGLRLGHLMRSVPLVGKRFSRGPFPYGGDLNTINTGGYTVWHGLDRQGYGAAYRQVIDLADFDSAVFQLPGGNSGIPGHPRYDDCTQEFLAGRYRPLLYSRAAIEAQTEHLLTLVPETGA